MNFIFFFQKLDLGMFVDLNLKFILFFPEIGSQVCLWTWRKKFSPDTLRVNLEVIKLLHLCMDCHEVCLQQ